MQSKARKKNKCFKQSNTLLLYRKQEAKYLSFQKSNCNAAAATKVTSLCV